MVQELERTEISEIADLARLVDEVRASGRPRALTRNGEAVAEIRPVAARKAVARSRGSKPKSRTATESEAFLSSAGSWEGLLDVEKLKAGFRESRAVLLDETTRRAVKISTEAELAVSHSAAGGWQDVDVDRLIADIYADRDLADRPPIAL